MGERESDKKLGSNRIQGDPVERDGRAQSGRSDFEGRKKPEFHGSVNCRGGKSSELKGQGGTAGVRG